MQREKAEAEEAARNKSDTAHQSTESSQTVKAEGHTEKPSTPQQSPGITASNDRKNSSHSSTSRPKHQKSRSEAAREATFASLQRALNAAVAARDQYGTTEVDSDPSVSPTTAPPSNNNYANDEANGQNTLSQPFSELKGAEDSSIPWIPQTSEGFGYGGFNGTPYSSAGEWTSQVQAPAQSFPGHRAASDAGASYNNMHLSSLQPPEIPLARRGSSDELANTLEGIGIRPASSHNLAQPGHGPIQPSATPKDTGKELDLAARRKRPRPAAIGTSGSGRSYGAPNRSPTRVPSINTGVRQSKSSQSLGSRYAGVKKASAAQRSPLNFSTFAEAGALNSTKAEMLQPSVTCSMAPPTPITPETLHHLLPTSPADGYCLSAQPSTQFFPATQPMPINMASPPATPLPMDVMSQFSYPNMAPPMSAPAEYSSFPDYTSCEAVPLTARSWTDSASVPSPSMAFQNSCQLAQADISPISYDPTVEHPTTNALSGSPLVYPTKDTDMATSAGLTGDTKASDFFIHEFPEQQEVHRYVAQQVPSHKRRNYVFANKTPMAFGSH